MCASDAQNNLEQSQSEFYNTLMSQDATEFGEDQGILTQLQSTYAPIIAAGPSQNGFSQAETNDLNTTASEGVATDYASANKALKENQAAQGGGNTYLPSGVAEQQEGDLDASAAEQEATEQLQIKQAGYTQGNQNFNNATNAMEGTAGLLNPEGGAGVATSAGTAEGTTANQIAQENESWMAPLIGAAGAVGAAALGPAKGATPCWVAAEIFGGWEEPRTVMVREWLLDEFAHSIFGAWVLALYMEYGERTAAAIKKSRALRWIFTHICNLALRQAKKAGN